MHQFELTDDQLQIQEMARKFTADAITPFAAEWDEKHIFPKDTIREAAELSREAPAPRKTKHEPKAAPGLHPDFASALAEAPKAKAALDGFPPSAQRDYLEWISEAKQEATRQKRIATAIEWLSEGKRRHWKYQNC